LRKRKEKGEKNMKKLNSFILGVLLLTSALVVFAPVMPANAIFKPEFFVSPSKTKFYSPCIVSTEFDISVSIFNEKPETGQEIYAFEFWLYWPNSTFAEPLDGIGPGYVDCFKQSFVTLENVEVKPPWPETQYFIIANETNYNATLGKWVAEWKTISWANPFNNGIAESWTTYWNWYHLAITGLDKAPPLVEIKAPVVDLTFHLDVEPLWPDVWALPFALEDTKMSKLDPLTGAPTPVDHFPEDGGVKVISQQPELWLSTEKAWDEDEDGDTDFFYVVRWINATTFLVEVNVLNVGGMYSFHLDISYNATLMDTDLQNIHIKDFLPPPYSLLNVTVYVPCDPWADLAHIYIDVERPCEKPPVCGEGKIVNITFKVKCPTISDGGCPPKPVYILPATVVDYITIQGAMIDSKIKVCGTYYTRTYGYGTISGVQKLDIGPPQDPIVDALYPTPPPGKYHTDYDFVEYWFMPRKADLDQSGHVDIADLTAIAKQFGKSGNQWADAFAKLASPLTGAVDLYDVVYVAKYFCKPYVPIDPYTEEPYDP
jgi:hypothetical protein